MSFDGNGNWVADFSAVSDRDANIKILASRFDNIHQADLKASFEKCLTNDGQIRPLQAFNFNSFKGINLANATNNTDAVNLQTLNSAISTLLSTMYPVGSVYIGTQNTCPMASLISGSTWDLVASDKALWTGNGTNGNTTKESALPNIKGTFTAVKSWEMANPTGTFSLGNSTRGPDGSSGTTGRYFNFSASDSSSVYKDGQSIVQPPAYVVNVWRRTA